MPFENYEYHEWFERDRQHVELRDPVSGATIVEWWDRDVDEAVEDGFLDPRDLEGSAVAYAKELGLIGMAPGMFVSVPLVDEIVILSSSECGS